MSVPVRRWLVLTNCYPAVTLILSLSWIVQAGVDHTSFVELAEASFGGKLEPEAARAPTEPGSGAIETTGDTAVVREPSFCPPHLRTAAMHKRGADP